MTPRAKALHIVIDAQSVAVGFSAYTDAAASVSLLFNQRFIMESTAMCGAFPTFARGSQSLRCTGPGKILGTTQTNHFSAPDIAVLSLKLLRSTHV